MTHLFRKGNGKPLREAMRAAGLSGPQLAEATREVDPAGKGLSAAAIGKITGRGKTAQDRCRLGSAWLLVEALETKGVVAPLQHLFARTPTPMPSDSTSTVERSSPDAHEG
jgi:hypothetical protein